MSDGFAEWIRGCIRTRRALARHLVESEAARPEWHESSSGVLVTGAPQHDDAWAGMFAIGDSRLSRFMACHDPRDTIARCDAELAILADHASNDHETYPECVHCAVQCFPCRTVRLVGEGYRHWDGYREEWGAVW